MICFHCGSLAPPTGFCVACGRSVRPTKPDPATEVTVTLPALSEVTLSYGIPAVTYDPPPAYHPATGPHPAFYGQSGGIAAIQPQSPAVGQPGIVVTLQAESPNPVPVEALDLQSAITDLYRTVSGQPETLLALQPHSPAPGLYQTVHGQPDAPPPNGATAPYGRPWSTGNTLSIVAMALAIVAILVAPLLGLVSIAGAVAGLVRRERLATVALVLGLVGTAGGFLYGLLSIY
jgi:hypothetical protein